MTFAACRSVMMSVLREYSPNRRTLLLLGGAIAPFVALLWLGIGIIRQERELTEKRANDDQRRFAALAGHELSAHLQTIMLRALKGVTPGDPEIALTGSVESGMLRLPWQVSAGAESQPDLADLRTAMYSDQMTTAARPREIAKNSASTQRRAQAISLMAIALRKGAKPADAAAAEQELYRLPPDVADEYGVPFFLYAARRKVVSQDLPPKMFEKLETALSSAWMPPPAAFMIADIARQAGAAGAALEQRALIRAKELERAAGMLLEIVGNSSIGWRMSTDTAEPLIASFAETRKTVFAVRSRSVLSAIPLPSGASWIIGSGAQGLTAHDSLPQIKVRFAERPPANASLRRQLLYSAALALVLITTAMSAFLLHRDIRRETGLARLRSGFVSSVSHELRTPIAAIRAYAEMLDMGRIDSAERPTYLKTIIGESERLSRLVETVLEFSRLEQGKRPYRFEIFRLNEAIESAVQAMRYTLEQSGFTIRISSLAEPSVHADRQALEQVFVNLLNNAVKYSGERREIDVCVRRQNDDGMVDVRDYGIGIAAEDHKRVFERFYRAETAGGRIVPGVGLGLSIVEQVVSAHGGRVALESAPGKGSTFSVILPAHA
jgi:signal transduction histidine kinase